MTQTILLTGGSGVVGQALLPQLSDVNVIALTRQRRLRNEPLTTLPGDIALPLLGLDGTTYRQLAAQVDWIIHAAALTDFARPMAELQRCNVTGVRNMLSFAQAANAPMIHVSTAFVQPRRSHRFNRYERSKRAAEAIIRSSGHPVTIVRPSIIVGDSQTGQIGKQQGIHRIMRLILDGVLPVVPGTTTARIDFVPQDRVAEAIVGLLRHEITDGDYWLTAGEAALRLPDGLTLLAEQGSQLLQRQVKLPQLVTQPTFADMVRHDKGLSLSADTRRRIEESMGLFAYMTTGEALRSSVHDLHKTIGLTALPDPQQTFQRSLEYIVDYQRGRPAQ